MLHSISYPKNLRCLRVSYYKSSNPNGCQDMDIDVIPLLAKLEGLMIDVHSYDHWFKEVVDIMRQHSLSWKDREQLASFRFFVGHQNWKSPRILEYFKYKIDRYLGYCQGNCDDNLIICDLLPETDALELIEHKDITSLVDFVNVSSFNRIRGCLIERCNKMTTIADGSKVEGGFILRKIEQLHLSNLPSLQTVFQGTLSPESLSKLPTLVVSSCPMLRKLFSGGVIQQLSKLQKLAMQNCIEIEELITGQDSTALPNLEMLILIEMPKLMRLSAGNSSAWPSLKELEVYKCPQLKSQPFDKDNAANLKSIEGEKIWWQGLQWTQNDVKEQLQSICSLRPLPQNDIVRGGVFKPKNQPKMAGLPHFLVLLLSLKREKLCLLSTNSLTGGIRPPDGHHAPAPIPAVGHRSWWPESKQEPKVYLGLQKLPVTFGISGGMVAFIATTGDGFRLVPNGDHRRGTSTSVRRLEASGGGSWGLLEEAAAGTWP
ncbi:Detected protein of unknown function [Hibiscus syriacus]|uniref:Disease resistance protein At4g27190-like leucine-rich repeats domain-containing protein n=1 Tax=Hibiscus syriacus TaxID=106335 RepID=A0A6A2Y762_HIBSY|nr:Detected protein of unknown function [Hibiscus syriacus]